MRILRVVNRDDPITEIVAKRIIEAAQTGIRDPVKLCMLAIKDLKARPR